MLPRGVIAIEDPWEALALKTKVCGTATESATRGTMKMIDESDVVSLIELSRIVVRH
jgi:hypothetical protein